MTDKQLKLLLAMAEALEYRLIDAHRERTADEIRKFANGVSDEAS